MVLVTLKETRLVHANANRMMSKSPAVGIAKLAALSFLTLLLLNSLGIVNKVPTAYATTSCSPNGGPNQGDHYWAVQNNTGGIEYGTLGIIEATSWNIYSINGSVSVWTDLEFYDPGHGHNWMQAGLVAGLHDGPPPQPYSSSRIPYTESHIYGDTWAVQNWWTSYPIPGSDNNAAEVYAASHNSDGSYTIEMFVNSTKYNMSFSTSRNAGMTDYRGYSEIGSESVYLSSNNCAEYDNTTNKVSVSTAVSISGSWSLWGSSNAQINSSPPYVISRTLNYEYDQYCSAPPNGC